MFIALARIRSEGQPPAVGAPRQPAGIHAQLRKQPGLASRNGDQMDLTRGRGLRVTRIGQVPAPVETVVHPVEVATVEALCQTAFEV